MEQSHNVVIEKIRAINFRSIDNNWMEMNFTKHANTLVVSEDNGAGKSTLLIHALFYALFNKAYGEDDKKTSLVNSTTRKATLVEAYITSFGKDILIRRGMKPTIFEILVKNVEGEYVAYDQEASLSDPQAILEQLIPLDETSFINAVALGVDKFKPFIFMKTAQRRPFVENILGLDIFTNMSVVAKEKRQVARRQATDLEYEINKKDAELKNEQQIYDMQEANSQDLIDSAENRVAQIAPRVSEAEEAHASTSAKLSKVQEKVQELDGKLESDLKESKDRFDKERADMDGNERDQLEPIKAQMNAELKQFDDTRDQQLQDRQAEEMDKVIQAGIPFDADVALAEGEVDKAQQEVDIASEQQSDAQLKIREATNMVQSLESQLKRSQSECDYKQKQIDDIYNQSDCPTCKQPITDEMKGDASKQLVADLESLDRKVIEEESDLSIASSRVSDLQNTIGDYTQRLQDAHNDLGKAKDQLDKVKAERQQAIDQAKHKSIEAIGELKSEFTAKRREIEDKFNAQLSQIQTDFRVQRETLESKREQALSAIREAASDSQSKVRALLAQFETQERADRQALDNVKRDLSEAQRELDTLRNKPKFDFEAQRAKIGAIETAKTKLEAEYDELDVRIKALNALADQILTDKGIKASIVDKYLPFLNQRVNEYLNAMNLYLNLEMDTAYNITMNAPDRRGQTVYSLSNGQKARVNVAYMLAWRDIADMRSSISVNLLGLDETLENVSESGVKETIDIVKQAAKGKNLFVVTQRNSEFEEHFDHVIKYALRNGATTVV